MSSAATRAQDLFGIFVCFAGIMQKKSSEIDFTPSSTSLDFTDVPPKIKMTSVFVHSVFILANSCILFTSMLSLSHKHMQSNSETRRLTTHIQKSLQPAVSSVKLLQYMFT